MLQEEGRAIHDLFGVQPGGQVLHYSSDMKSGRFKQFQSAHLTIWKLRKLFTLFALYLNFWGVKKPTPHARQEIHLVWSVLDRLKNKTPVPRTDLQQTAIILMQLGVSRLLAEMQKYREAFHDVLTPQFRALMAHFDFSMSPKDELIFHPCNPDIYLWTPSKSPPEKLLVVFLTASNTVNMPRAMAHILFSRLNVGVMYIGNRPNMKPHEFIVGHDLHASAKLILDISQSLGVKKLYGLGPSYGGFKACQLAHLLSFERVLNFSGAADGRQQRLGDASHMAPHYPLRQILTVLSSTDEADQHILASYEKEGFLTPRAFVDTPSHGSFTSAFLEGKLPDYLAWLLHGGAIPH